MAVFAKIVAFRMSPPIVMKNDFGRLFAAFSTQNEEKEKNVSILCCMIRQQSYHERN